MSLSQTFKHLKIAALFGGVLGIGIGCVINFEPITPCDSGSHNKINDDGQCECLPGYEFCTDDPDDLECCDDDIGSGTSGPTTTTTTTTGDGDGDTTGDGDGDPATGDGDGDTTGDGDGDPTGGDECELVELPPDSCLPEEEGFVWCSNSDEMAPECGQFFVCLNGVWTESPEDMQASCEFDGYDFAYGCFDDGESVIFECGDGSGEACNNSDPAFCVDMDLIGYCQYGKITNDSCQDFCENVGIDDQLYEYGECDASIPDDVACFCCDSGDDGCPI